MGMNVGELQSTLATADPELELLIAVDGAFVPVGGVTLIKGSPFVMIRGATHSKPSNRLSIIEEGILGKLVINGLSDDDIAEVLGRPAEFIARKRKALGITPKPN